MVQESKIETDPKMKLLIVGAGIIGSIYGWALSQAKHEVIHLVRPGKSKQFAQGIAIDMLDNRKGYKSFVGRYALKTTEQLNPSDNFDLVIVPTKPYQLTEALEQIVPQTQADLLLLTQNWDGVQAIDALVPPSRYVYGDAKAGGSYQSGTLVATIFPTIDLGQTHRHHDPCLAKIASLFECIAVKPVLHDDILEYIWVQYAINAGLWPPLVRAGRLEALLRDQKNALASLRTVKECLQVVARRGIDLAKFPDAKMYLNDSPIGRWIAGMALTFMFRFNKSVQRSSAHALGDPREIKSAYYDLVNLGRQLSVAMPTMASYENDIACFGGA
jgi:2-dehydropantoate 2-reductase